MDALGHRGLPPSAFATLAGSPRQATGYAGGLTGSFGDAACWMMADSYSRMFNVVGLSGSSDENVALADRLVISGTQTVFFAGTPLDYSTFMDRCSDYFVE